MTDEGKPVADPALFPVPRSLNPAGGLISSARDQLRYARFHLGEEMVHTSRRVLTERSLVAMRSNPGPGGTIILVAAAQRPRDPDCAAWRQLAGPALRLAERDFALTVLTDSLCWS